MNSLEEAKKDGMIGMDLKMSDLMTQSLTERWWITRVVSMLQGAFSIMIYARD
ncbi:hypothetical protein GYMLUDRAFT_49318 [Collybiopsis luxurians FD-317 M1]|uniref:Uncharacterized protein n=1 Tax=Collybiopsis luxurians FD-317 M1 TaxID=944289 RepID=A0A0D0BV16_9AGAR|nr:hypothetical protein GYMLUDRAFT_49318 [Collybiopsis luxurians FD-317 M1]